MNISGGLCYVTSGINTSYTNLSPENPARKHRMNRDQKNVVTLSPRFCNHFSVSLKTEAWMTMRKAAQTLGLCGFLAETVGFYPRAKKHATGMFFPACGPSSCSHLHLSTAKQRTPTSGWCSLFWRKRWDSNPRVREGYLISRKKNAEKRRCFAAFLLIAPGN